MQERCPAKRNERKENKAKNKQTSNSRRGGSAAWVGSDRSLEPRHVICRLLSLCDSCVPTALLLTAIVLVSSPPFAQGQKKG